MSDWLHTGEGLRAFLLLGVSQPNDARFRERMTRFAVLYMNEDAGAPKLRSGEQGAHPILPRPTGR